MMVSTSLFDDFKIYKSLEKEGPKLVPCAFENDKNASIKNTIIVNLIVFILISFKY